MKTKINPIGRAYKAMAQDRVNENRGLTANHGTDAVSAIILLSRRIGQLELDVARLNTVVLGKFKVVE